MLKVQFFVCIFFIFSTSNSDGGRKCSYYEVNGFLKANVAKKEVDDAYTEQECIMKACNDCKETKCVVTWDMSGFGLCEKYVDQAKAYDAVIYGDFKVNNYVSTLIVPEEEEIKLPIPDGLWLFDEITRGKNIGSKGTLLDCVDIDSGTPNMTGPFQWNAKVPNNAQSRLNLVTTPGTRESFCIINLYNKNNSLILNVEKPLTIAFWIKTNNKSVHMPIFEGRGLYTFDLWLYPSEMRDQLSFCPMDNFPNKQIYTTIRDATGVNEWRHMAVVFKGPGDVTFYLNGNVWPHNNPHSPMKGTWQPYEFRVFNWGSYQAPLYGSLTCLVYYENKILDKEQINVLMNSCP